MEKANHPIETGVLVNHKLTSPVEKLCVAMKVDRSGSGMARGCLKVLDCHTPLPYVCHRRCNNYDFIMDAAHATNKLLQLR